MMFFIVPVPKEDPSLHYLVGCLAHHMAEMRKIAPMNEKERKRYAAQVLAFGIEVLNWFAINSTSTDTWELRGSLKNEIQEWLKEAQKILDA